MSFRVGTPNYGLPQTEGTDKRDWSDTNQPFLVIDTAIKNAVDTSASASAAAATAQQTADGAGTAAAHAQTDATTAQTLATSASEVATTAKNRADSAYAKAVEVEGIVNKESVVVTADGVKTYEQLLNQLFNSLTLSKLTDTSYIEYQRTNDRLLFEIGYEGGSSVRYGHFTGNQLESFNVYTSGSTYIRIDFSGLGTNYVYTDKSSEVPSAGHKITLFY